MNADPTLYYNVWSEGDEDLDHWTEDLAEALSLYHEAPRHRRLTAYVERDGHVDTMQYFQWIPAPTLK